MRELHSIEAEQSLIGCLLIAPKRYDDIASIISSLDFASEQCSVIFSAIESIIREGNPVDVITVSEYLERQSKEVLEISGGLNFLIDLGKNTPSAYNIARYAEIIREFTKERTLYRAASDVQGLMMAEGLTTDERFQEAEAIFTGLGSQATDHKTVGVKQATKEYIDQLEHRFNNPGIHGIKTNLEQIDCRLQGLKGGELYVIAARPAMGKTTYAMSFVSAACFDGYHVYFASLEMPRTQLVQRLMASVGRINLASLKDASVLGSEDSYKVAAAAGRIINMNLEIDDQGGLDVNEMRSRCRAMKRKQGLDMIVVDYLQLLGDRTSSGRFEEVSSISRKLKALAKELDCPVVALSQLSRKCEERTDKRPMLSDLRESGQIEQDADVIQFLYRDEVYNEETDRRGIVEIITGKFRDGEVGTDHLAFIGAQNRFENLAHIPEQQKAPKRRGFSL